MNFQTLKEDLLSFVEEACRYAERKKISDYEVFVSSYSNSQVTIQGGMVNANDGVSEGIGVRVALGKKIGFASSTGLSPEAMRFAFDEALAVARTLDEENKKFQGFAPSRKGGKDGIVDKKLLNLAGEGLVSIAGQIYSDALHYDKRVVSATSDVFLNFGGCAIANSCGIEKSSRLIACGGSVETTSLEGDKRKTGFDFIVKRSNPEFSELGESGAKKSCDMLHSRPLGISEKMVTVWEPLAAAQFVETAFSSSINGRSVVEGRSAFAEKMGMEIGIPGLTVIDAGQLPESIFTTAIDGEGTPRKDTPIMENGILKNFLFDHYYARIYGKESTGNASRGSFTNPPGISPTTLKIEPGKRSMEEIIAQTDRGILVTGIIMGMGHSNLISGDFSVVVPNPYLIEKREVKNPLEPVTIAGNLYQSLSQIRAIGSDALLTPLAFTPTLSFEGFTVSG